MQRELARTKRIKTLALRATKEGVRSPLIKRRQGASPLPRLALDTDEGDLVGGALTVAEQLADGLLIAVEHGRLQAQKAGRQAGSLGGNAGRGGAARGGPRDGAREPPGKPPRTSGGGTNMKEMLKEEIAARVLAR